ncbi:MAG TPA: hypothetical protein PK093_02995 [Phycisphaerae bacterium]|nr:hypothetical protein [Phycisphaerae bacterium]
MAGSRSSPPPWRPTQLLRVVKSFDTSMGTTLIKTDATFAYIKAMGNRQGPHALAAEFVASSLARWFGLTVPDFAIMPLAADAVFDLPRGIRTLPGPAFVSRRKEGRTWGGSIAELKALENVDDLTRLIVFDTWVRNCDRHPPDLETRKPNYANVLLADTEKSSRSRLIALDHTHCFDCGRDFSERLSDIGKVKDERTYGLFPEFAPLVDPGALAWSQAMLRGLPEAQVRAIVSAIPAEWDVSATAAEALSTLIHGRAAFVADRIDSGWPLDGSSAGA